MFHISVECTIEKDIDSVFLAITDHENYDKFPGIDTSKLLEEGKLEKNGEGAIRIIGAGLFEFKERITAFEKPIKMNYLIEETSPIPILHEKGEITLAEENQSTHVVWVSEGRTLVPIIGRLLDKIIELQVSTAFRAILQAIEGQ